MATWLATFATGPGQCGVIVLPSGVDRLVGLTGQAADLLIIDPAKRGVIVERNEALTWLRAEMLHGLQPPTAALEGGLL